MTYFQIINHLPDLIANTLQPPLGSTDTTEYHLSEKLWIVLVQWFLNCGLHQWDIKPLHVWHGKLCRGKKTEENQMKKKELCSYYLGYHDFIVTLDPFLLILTDQNWVEWKSCEFYWIIKHFWLIWGMPKRLLEALYLELTQLLTQVPNTSLKVSLVRMPKY